MTEFFLETCKVLRPILFLGLLAYLPMKFGIGFDLAAKAPTPNEIEIERNKQLQLIRSPGLRSALLRPLRLLVTVYFTLWLVIDRFVFSLVALFLLTIAPVLV